MSNNYKQVHILTGVDTYHSCGRSSLAWAVEYQWADAVRILLQFGADPNQPRPSTHGNLPLLHLAMAGLSYNSPGTDMLGVAKLLL